MSRLVLGCGESTVQAVRNADHDPENWVLARVLWPNTTREMIEGSKAPGDRWCVLVDNVSDADLDGDIATDCYETIYDFDAALRACTGFDPRDPALRNQAIATLRAEREAPCSHPAEVRQQRLPSGTRCGACDETFS